MDIESAKKQIGNLPNFQGNPEKLLKAAKKRVKLSDKDLDAGIMFSDDKEKRLAKILLKKYLDDYTIETIADKNTLKQLIYFEVIQYRLQKVTNDAHNEHKAVPLKYLDSLHKNSNQIIALKQTLGITHEKANKSNAYQHIEAIKKKFKNWADENVAERSCICGHCGETLILRLRMDKYDVNKHPFFKGRFITNKHLLKLYKNDVISKKDVSLILDVSTDYVDWYIEKIEIKEQGADSVA